MRQIFLFFLFSQLALFGGISASLAAGDRTAIRAVEAQADWADLNALSQLAYSASVKLGGANNNGVSIGLDLTSGFAKAFSRNDLTFTINATLTSYVNASQTNPIASGFFNFSSTTTFGGLAGCCTVYFSNLQLVTRAGARASISGAVLSSVSSTTSGGGVTAYINTFQQDGQPGSYLVGPMTQIASVSASITATASDGSSVSFNTPLMTVLAPVAAGNLAAVSLDKLGNFGQAPSYSPTVTRDGQTISFVTSAENLLNVGLGSSSSQIVRFYQPAHSISLVSSLSLLGATAAVPSDGNNYSPALSADGSVLTFSSDATNIDPRRQGTGRSVYFVDPRQSFIQQLSANPSLILPAIQGTGTGIGSNNPTASSEGNWIAFQSDNKNLVPGTPAGISQIYLANVLTGSISIVSATSTGFAGDHDSKNPSISDDGKLVLFESDAQNFGASGHQIWLKNLETGALTLISAANDKTPGNAPSMAGKLSGDGRWAAFESDATNLAAGLVPRNRQVYRRDIKAGTNALISIGADGQPASSDAKSAGLSEDGRYAVFQSPAANLGVSDKSPAIQIFVRDLFSGRTAIVSTDITGASGNADSLTPAISGNGRVIVFSSNATNLDGTRTNNVAQIYMATNPLTGPVTSGWWWDPSRPGQMMAVEEHGNSIFFGQSQFDAHGTPYWSVAGQNFVSENTYLGTSVQPKNGSTLFGPYVAPTDSISLGSLNTRLSTPVDGSLSLDGNSRAIRRFEFVTGGLNAGQIAGYPETGWWWNPAMAGQALFLEVQGSTILLQIFVYGESGQSIWYTATGTMKSPSSFSSALYQCKESADSGPPLDCTTSVGTIGLTFSTSLTGQLTLSNSAVAKLVSYAIKRYRF